MPVFWAAIISDAVQVTLLPPVSQCHAGREGCSDRSCKSVLLSGKPWLIPQRPDRGRPPPPPLLRLGSRPLIWLGWFETDSQHLGLFGSKRHEIDTRPLPINGGGTSELPWLGSGPPGNCYWKTCLFIHLYLTSVDLFMRPEGKKIHGGINSYVPTFFPSWMTSPNQFGNAFQPNCDLRRKVLPALCETFSFPFA